MSSIATRAGLATETGKTPRRLDVVTSARWWRQGRWLALLGCGLVLFAAHLWLALAFYRRSLFGDYDFLFDADPNIRILAFTDVYPGGDAIFQWLPNSVHPLLPYAFGAPVFLAAKLGSLITGVPAHQLSTMLAIMVPPLAAALQVVMLVVLLTGLGLPWIRAALIAALGAVSFSDVVFGSIPESFPITSALMVLVLLLQYGPPVGSSTATRFGKWIAKVLSIGVVITNAGWIWAAEVFARPWPEATRVRTWVRTAVPISLLTLGIIIVGYVLVDLDGYAAKFRAQLEAAEAAGTAKPAMVERFTTFDLAHIERQLIDVPRTFLRTFYPPRVRVMDKEDLGKVIVNIQRRFTLTAIPSTPLELGVDALLLGLMAAGLRAGWQDVRFRPLSAFAVFVLASNIGLHLVFGREPFLYSQHWVVAVLLCIAPALLPAAKGNRAALGVTVILLGACALQSGLLVGFLLGTPL